MKIRSTLVALVAGAALLLPATSAGAGPAPAPKATGSVALGTPVQYLSFSAIGGTTVKGNVAYTNFDNPVATSDVYDIRSWSAFDYLGSYLWEIDVTGFTPTSPTSSSFTGQAIFADPSYTADVVGTVVGNAISYTLDYTGAETASVWTATGTIAPDGSMTGTAAETPNGYVATWNAPAGSAVPVFSYTAPVTCVSVSGTTASFGYTIPAGVPLAGLGLVFTVTDGGSSGAGNDTVGFALASACPTAPTSFFPVTGGNVVVH